MQDILTLLSKAPTIYIKRSGLATMARLATDLLAKDVTSVLVPTTAEAYVKLKSLLPLFSRESAERAQDFSIPQWERPMQFFAANIMRSSRELQAQNIAALYALLQKAPHCVLLPLETLMLRHVPREFFRGRVLSLSVGQEYAPMMILEQAVGWGYERVSLVSGYGEIALRGDILDIYPPGYDRPIRLEFFGDNLEEIRLFDADTQRSRQTLPELTILPVSFRALTVQETEEASQNLVKVSGEGVISEQEAKDLQGALASFNHKLLPGICFPETSLIEDWFESKSVFFLADEGTVVTAEDELRSELESFVADTTEGNLVQPKGLIFREKSNSAPWSKFKNVIFAETVFTDEREGLDFLERPINGFATLFPKKEAQDRPWQALMAGLKTWRKNLRQVILSFSTVRARNKFVKLAQQDGISAQLAYDSRAKGLFALVAPFRQGSELFWDETLILGEEIIFPKGRKSQGVPRGKFRGLHTFDGLKEGDLLVHRDYGIGRFGGLHHIKLSTCANDFLLIEYAGHDKLYVPADNIGLIQRYQGGDNGEPSLDRLGGSGWKNSRDKAKKAIEKIAADLVEMYAYRKLAKGFQYGPLPDLYHELEATFEYEETPDQAQAIQDVLDDMAKPTPMDRLVCGDVGFGKTEVALRAAFRAAAESRQVALLCPTTVLAEQHYQTFRSRLKGFPVKVGLLSRFVPKAKQAKVLQGVAKGSIDILIGTHRILSNDVHLPNLGLLILDEEQRFGVRHKEKLKTLKKNVDVLALTATPIPRTLQLSMSGIRDLSLIETAPENRKVIETSVIRKNDKLLAEVINRELERKGQVFWVYNRVQGLARCAEYVQKIVPNAKVEIAHGQMSEAVLEKTIYHFWRGEIDILVCTSIIESGLDFPNVNTIVIDQAQMFGLGQLYQLRGRVGRSERQAYAYLVVPDTLHLTKVAEERLRVIQDMDYLGAGFQLSMEDLRLRGSGNILGEVQSGQMGRVGIDLYLEMLENAVARLRGLPESHLTETELNLGLPAHIPMTYIDDSHERMRFYKILTSAKSPQEREDIVLEIRDRFGTMPVELLNFIAVLNIKQLFMALQVGRADINSSKVTITWVQGQDAVDPTQVLALVHMVAGAKVIPPASVVFPLDQSLPFEKGLDALRLRLAGLVKN